MGGSASFICAAILSPFFLSLSLSLELLLYIGERLLVLGQLVVRLTGPNSSLTFTDTGQTLF